MGIFARLRALFHTPPSAPAAPPAMAPDRTPEITLDGAPFGEERRQRPRVNAREGTRVLIIDDSKTILAVLRKFLRSAGYETAEVVDAETGLAALPGQRPELIFLDIILPGMNGFAALRAIRRDPATRDIPVIMMSGNEQAMEQFFGSRIGADSFMKKPFSRQEVFFHIERLLDDQQIPRRATVRHVEA